MWANFWMRFGGRHILGRAAFGLASMAMPPYNGRRMLADMGKFGFISPTAKIYGDHITLGNNIYIDDQVVIYQGWESGPISLAEHVHILRGTIIESGLGGSLIIGRRTCIQPRCQISLYKGTVKIGKNVQIAPNCSFYPYNHSIQPGLPIKNQPLFSKGGIIIEDDVWLGVGSTILDGVHIGHGAVVAAGSVVNRNIPSESIAAGVPARVVKIRADNITIT
jgi:acetyltransferase-like isoleucine patch superfamily enzyme